MHLPRHVDDLLTVVLVVLLIRTLPRLEGLSQRVVLVSIAAAATLILTRAVVRFPGARRVWAPAAVAGALLVVFQSSYFVLDDSTLPATTRLLGRLLSASSAVAAVAVGGWAFLRVAQPLLSFAPTRRAMRWVLPAAVAGLLGLPLADPLLFPNGRGVLGHVLPTVPVVLGLTGIAWGVRELRPVLRTGRDIELRTALAVASLLALTLVSVYADYTRYRAVPAAVSVVLMAAASLRPSAGLAGSPIDFRPTVEPVRLRWAFMGVAAGGPLVFGMQFGLAPTSTLVAALVALLAVFLIDGDLRSGPPVRSERQTDRIVALARSLPDALVHGGLSMHYQPFVRVHDRTVVGFEALLRWDHPEFGPVLPLEVVRAAHWCGLGEEFESHIVELVSRELPTVLAALTADEPFLSVNLSPRTLQREGFAVRLLDRLTAAGCSVDGLMVEIVEEGAVRDWDGLRANVDLLQEAGMLVALDDFGTGTSNLQYLSEIDVDLVKVDRTLVRWAADRGGAAPVRRLVELSRAAGSRVLAEGIENEHDLEVLAAIGVDLVQGYHLGMPSPIGVAVARVSEAVDRSVVVDAAVLSDLPAGAGGDHAGGGLGVAIAIEQAETPFEPAPELVTVDCRLPEPSAQIDPVGAGCVDLRKHLLEPFTVRELVICSSGDGLAEHHERPFRSDLGEPMERCE